LLVSSFSPCATKSQSKKDHNYLHTYYYIYIFSLPTTHIIPLLLSLIMSARPSSHHFGSNNSTSSSRSSSSSSSSDSGYRRSMDSIALPIASVEVLRCMRCARSVEATSTDDVSTMGMVRIAHNLYYCERCAKMVGYK